MNKKKPETVLLPSRGATLNRKVFLVPSNLKKVFQNLSFGPKKPQTVLLPTQKKPRVLKFKNATSSLGSLNLQTLPRSLAGPALICTDTYIHKEHDFSKVARTNDEKMIKMKPKNAAGKNEKMIHKSAAGKNDKK